MKDTMRLVNTFMNIYGKAETADARWFLLRRAEAILKRKNERQARILPAIYNDNQDDKIAENEPAYALLSTTVGRLQYTIGGKNVVPLKRPPFNRKP